MAFSYALVDVDGTVRVLDGSLGVRVNRGARGLAFPDTVPAGDKLPYAPGTALRRLSTNPGQLELPLVIEAASSALLDAVADDLRGWILPGTERRSGPRTVYLRVTRDDGAVREIEGVAKLSAGDDSMGMPIWQRWWLSLYCPDPYWRDAVATEVEFSSGEGTSSWFPLYPYDLVPSGIFAERTITNTGDVEAWPIITINGPGANPVLVNETTGEELALSGVSLGAGESITIDTSERGSSAKTITNAGGSNLWPYATLASSMWPLEVGDNVIRVDLEDADLVTTAVTLSYRRRWAGGHR